MEKKVRINFKDQDGSIVDVKRLLESGYKFDGYISGGRVELGEDGECYMIIPDNSTR